MKPKQYQLQLLQKEELELQAERSLIPIAVPSNHSPRRPGFGLLLFAVSGLAVEGGFLFYFLRETVQLQVWQSCLMTVGLVSMLSGGGKRVLDSLYDDVLEAVRKVRRNLRG